ncbi:MAG: hypothetical protein Fur0022_39550 [Anaerolineales bacterium]
MFNGGITEYPRRSCPGVSFARTSQHTGQVAVCAASSSPSNLLPLPTPLSPLTSNLSPPHTAHVARVITFNNAPRKLLPACHPPKRSGVSARQ